VTDLQELQAETLKKIKLAMLIPISKALIDDFTIDRGSDLYAGMYYDKLKNIFWGKWAESTVVAKYPQNWWEHLKERWMPYKLRKKFPIKYTEVRAQGGVVFPVTKLPNGTFIWRSGNEVYDEEKK